jgi:hypothetical protein
MYPSARSNATVQKEEEEEKEDLAIPGTGRWFRYNSGLKKLERNDPFEKEKKGAITNST